MGKSNFTLFMHFYGRTTLAVQLHSTYGEPSLLYSIWREHRMTLPDSNSRGDLNLAAMPSVIIGMLRVKA